MRQNKFLQKHKKKDEKSRLKSTYFPTNYCLSLIIKSPFEGKEVLHFFVRLSFSLELYFFYIWEVTSANEFEVTPNRLDDAVDARGPSFFYKYGGFAKKMTSF